MDHLLTMTGSPSMHRPTVGFHCCPDYRPLKSSVMLSTKKLTSILCLLIALPVVPALANKPIRPDRLEYAAIITAGKKIGYAVTEFKTKDNMAHSTTRIVLKLHRGATKLTFDTTHRCVETLDGKPVSFALALLQGLTTQNIEGFIDNAGKLNVTIVSGVHKQTRKIDWPEGAVLEHGSYLAMRRAGLKLGTKVTFKTLDPMSLTPITATFTVGKRTKVDLLGHVVLLTEIQTLTKGRMGSISGTNYVDENCETFKIIKSMIGIQIELVKCAKEIAMEQNDVLDILNHLKPNDVLDILNRSVLACPTPLENLPSRKTISYTIEATSIKAKLDLPTTDNQTIKRVGRDRIILTVSPVSSPKAQTMPYKGNDADALAALKPTSHIQCDNKTIVALAKQAIGDATDATVAAKRIEAFVRSYISEKNLSVGYASAIEVTESREGDCTEHAVLTAALCRAAGIPAQIVGGMVYIPEFAGRKSIFAPHVWNRVLIGNKWIGLDAAIGTYDSGHIAVSYGNSGADDWMRLVDTLGMFEITSVISGTPPKEDY